MSLERRRTREDVREDVKGGKGNEKHLNGARTSGHCLKDTIKIQSALKRV